MQEQWWWRQQKAKKANISFHISVKLQSNNLNLSLKCTDAIYMLINDGDKLMVPDF